MDFQVESGDLIAYGLIPEFVGRFPILAGLSALNEDQLFQVFHMFMSNLYPSSALYSCKYTQTPPSRLYFKYYANAVPQRLVVSEK